MVRRSAREAGRCFPSATRFAHVHVGRYAMLVRQSEERSDPRARLSRGARTVLHHAVDAQRRGIDEHDSVRRSLRFLCRMARSRGVRVDNSSSCSRTHPANCLKRVSSPPTLVRRCSGASSLSASMSITAPTGRIALARGARATLVRFPRRVCLSCSGRCPDRRSGSTGAWRAIVRTSP
jgi:hypothetical protein